MSPDRAPSPAAGPARPDESGEIPFNVYDRNCPSRPVLDHITGRWGLLVLTVLLDQTLRFAQIRRRVDGVSDKMLAQTLQALERDGLVVRDQRSVMPPVVEYRLTPLGQQASEHGVALLRWVETSMPGIAAAQQRFDETGKS